jgi:NADH dehydrogenase [ubiquinone] 1 alpha subcomplex assembly factor 1
MRVCEADPVGCPEAPPGTSRLLALLVLAFLFPSNPSAQEQKRSAEESKMKLIADFAEPGANPWTIVNDEVMGGRSTSKMALSDTGTALFEGFVSLENNGGFASTRVLLPPLDLSGYAGVRLRVRGDGRRYQLRFRTDTAFDGVAYRAEFDTAPDTWIELRLPFANFQPSFRGSIPPDAEPLDLSRIRQLGFLIADQREGPFRLEIAWVKAYEAPQ